MVTMDNNPTIREVIAVRIAGRRKPRSMAAKAETRNRVTQIIAYVMNMLMQLAGFGCLTMAAFTWTITAGWIMAGVSFLVLSWLLTKPQPAPEDDEQQPHRPQMR